MEELRKLKSVTAVRGEPYVLRIVWKDGRTDIVDMTGIVHRHKAFAPLRDPAVFRKVRVITEGLGIGWDNDLDYAARSLRILSKAQAHRQSLAVTKSRQERRDQAFIDSVSDTED